MGKLKIDVAGDNSAFSSSKIPQNVDARNQLQESQLNRAANNLFAVNLVPESLRQYIAPVVASSPSEDNDWRFQSGQEDLKAKRNWFKRQDKPKPISDYVSAMEYMDSQVYDIVDGQSYWSMVRNEELFSSIPNTYNSNATLASQIIKGYGRDKSAGESSPMYRVNQMIENGYDAYQKQVQDLYAKYDKDTASKYANQLAQQILSSMLVLRDGFDKDALENGKDDPKTGMYTQTRLVFGSSMPKDDGNGGVDVHVNSMGVDLGAIDKMYMQDEKTGLKKWLPWNWDDRTRVNLLYNVTSWEQSRHTMFNKDDEMGDVTGFAFDVDRRRQLFSEVIRDNSDWYKERGGSETADMMKDLVGSIAVGTAMFMGIAGVAKPVLAGANKLIGITKLAPKLSQGIAKFQMLAVPAAVQSVMQDSGTSFGEVGPGTTGDWLPVLVTAGIASGANVASSKLLDAVSGKVITGFANSKIANGVHLADDIVDLAGKGNSMAKGMLEKGVVKDGLIIVSDADYSSIMAKEAGKNFRNKFLLSSPITSQVSDIILDFGVEASVTHGVKPFVQLSEGQLRSFGVTGGGEVNMNQMFLFGLGTRAAGKAFHAGMKLDVTGGQSADFDAVKKRMADYMVRSLNLVQNTDMAGYKRIVTDEPEQAAKKIFDNAFNKSKTIISKENEPDSEVIHSGKFKAMIQAGLQVGDFGGSDGKKNVLKHLKGFISSASQGKFIADDGSFEKLDINVKNGLDFGVDQVKHGFNIDEVFTGMNTKIMPVLSETENKALLRSVYEFFGLGDRNISGMIGVSGNDVAEARKTGEFKLSDSQMTNAEKLNKTNPELKPEAVKELLSLEMISSLKDSNIAAISTLANSTPRTANDVKQMFENFGTSGQGDGPRIGDHVFAELNSLYVATSEETGNIAIVKYDKANGNVVMSNGSILASGVDSVRDSGTTIEYKAKGGKSAKYSLNKLDKNADSMSTKSGNKVDFMAQVKLHVMNSFGSIDKVMHVDLGNAADAIGDRLINKFTEIGERWESGEDKQVLMAELRESMKRMEIMTEFFSVYSSSFTDRIARISDNLQKTSVIKSMIQDDFFEQDKSITKRFLELDDLLINLKLNATHRMINFNAGKRSVDLSSAMGIKDDIASKMFVIAHNYNHSMIPSMNITVRANTVKSGFSPNLGKRDVFFEDYNKVNGKNEPRNRYEGWKLEESVVDDAEDTINRLKSGVLKADVVDENGKVIEKGYLNSTPFANMMQAASLIAVKNCSIAMAKSDKATVNRFLGLDANGRNTFAKPEPWTEIIHSKESNGVKEEVIIGVTRNAWNTYSDANAGFQYAKRGNGLTVSAFVRTTTMVNDKSVTKVESLCDLPDTITGGKGSVKDLSDARKILADYIVFDGNDRLSYVDKVNNMTKRGLSYGTVNGEYLTTDEFKSRVDRIFDDMNHGDLSKMTKISLSVRSADETVDFLKALVSKHLPWGANEDADVEGMLASIVHKEGHMINPKYTASVVYNIKHNDDGSATGWMSMPNSGVMQLGIAKQSYSGVNVIDVQFKTKGEKVSTGYAMDQLKEMGMDKNFVELHTKGGNNLKTVLVSVATKSGDSKEAQFLDKHINEAFTERASDLQYSKVYVNAKNYYNNALEAGYKQDSSSPVARRLHLGLKSMLTAVQEDIEIASKMIDDAGIKNPVGFGNKSEVGKYADSLLRESIYNRNDIFDNDADVLAKISAKYPDVPFNSLMANVVDQVNSARNNAAKWIKKLDELDTFESSGFKTETEYHEELRSMFYTMTMGGYHMFSADKYEKRLSGALLKKVNNATDPEFQIRVKNFTDNMIANGGKLILMQNMTQDGLSFASKAAIDLMGYMFDNEAGKMYTNAGYLFKANYTPIDEVVGQKLILPDGTEHIVGENDILIDINAIKGISSELPAMFKDGQRFTSTSNAIELKMDNPALFFSNNIVHSSLKSVMKDDAGAELQHQNVQPAATTLVGLQESITRVNNDYENEIRIMPYEEMSLEETKQKGPRMIGAYGPVRAQQADRPADINIVGNTPTIPSTFQFGSKMFGQLMLECIANDTKYNKIEKKEASIYRKVAKVFVDMSYKKDDNDAIFNEFVGSHSKNARFKSMQDLTVYALDTVLKHHVLKLNTKNGTGYFMNGNRYPIDNAGQSSVYQIIGIVAGSTAMYPDRLTYEKIQGGDYDGDQMSMSELPMDGSMIKGMTHDQIFDGISKFQTNAIELLGNNKKLEAIKTKEYSPGKPAGEIDKGADVDIGTLMGVMKYFQPMLNVGFSVRSMFDWDTLDNRIMMSGAFTTNQDLYLYQKGLHPTSNYLVDYTTGYTKYTAGNNQYRVVATSGYSKKSLEPTNMQEFLVLKRVQDDIADEVVTRYSMQNLIDMKLISGDEKVTPKDTANRILTTVTDVFDKKPITGEKFHYFRELYSMIQHAGTSNVKSGMLTRMLNKFAKIGYDADNPTEDMVADGFVKTEFEKLTEADRIGYVSSAAKLLVKNYAFSMNSNAIRLQHETNVKVGQETKKDVKIVDYNSKGEATTSAIKTFKQGGSTRATLPKIDLYDMNAKYNGTAPEYLLSEFSQKKSFVNEGDVPQIEVRDAQLHLLRKYAESTLGTLGGGDGISTLNKIMTTKFSIGNTTITSLADKLVSKSNGMIPKSAVIKWLNGIGLIDKGNRLEFDKNNEVVKKANGPDIVDVDVETGLKLLSNGMTLGGGRNDAKLSKLMFEIIPGTYKVAALTLAAGKNNLDDNDFGNDFQHRLTVPADFIEKMNILIENELDLDC